MRIVDYSDTYRQQTVALIGLLQDYERALDASRPPGNEIANAHFDYLLECCAQQQGKTLLALFDDQVVGFVVGLIETIDQKDPQLYAAYKTYGLITDLFVLEEYRSKGIAQELMSGMEDYFTGLNVSTIRASTLVNNQLARGLYSGLGYRPFEITYLKEIGQK